MYSRSYSSFFSPCSTVTPTTAFVLSTCHWPVPDFKFCTASQYDFKDKYFHSIHRENFWTAFAPLVFGNLQMATSVWTLSLANPFSEVVLYRDNKRLYLRLWNIFSLARCFQTLLHSVIICATLSFCTLLLQINFQSCEKDSIVGSRKLYSCLHALQCAILRSTWSALSTDGR